jgi:Transposase IS116/IS110/IS902 family
VLAEDLGGCSPAQRLPRTGVQCRRDSRQVIHAVPGEVSPLREVLAQQAVGVLVGGALPRALRIAEVDLQNEVSAVLVRNLKGRPPASDVFGKRGRRWLTELKLPADEHDTLAACLRQIDFLDAEIAGVDEHLAKQALTSSEIKRLMTIPGIDVTTASTLIAAIGDIRRFPSAKQLVGYLGLDARVRQSGLTAARHGRISKKEPPPCAMSSCRPPGPRSRPRARCARSTSASKPAAARRSRSLPSHANLAMLCWQLTTGQNYAYNAPPSWHASCAR